jgi:hypothetical protein
MQPKMLASRSFEVFALVAHDLELRTDSFGQGKEDQMEVGVKDGRLWEHVKCHVLALRLVLVQLK